MLQKYTHSDLMKCSCEQTDSKRCWCGWKEVPPSTCMTRSTMAAMNQKWVATCRRKKLPARIQPLPRQFHQQLLKTNWKRRSRSAFYSVRLSAQSFLATSSQRRLSMGTEKLWVRRVNLLCRRRTEVNSQNWILSS
jgi:hypothetical protein